MKSMACPLVLLLLADLFQNVECQFFYPPADYFGLDLNSPAARYQVTTSSSGLTPYRSTSGTGKLQWSSKISTYFNDDLKDVINCDYSCLTILPNGAIALNSNPYLTIWDKEGNKVFQTGSSGVAPPVVAQDGNLYFYGADYCGIGIVNVLTYEESCLDLKPSGTYSHAQGNPTITQNGWITFCNIAVDSKGYSKWVYDSFDSCEGPVYFPTTSSNDVGYNKLFITALMDTSLLVYALDSISGETLWTYTVLSDLQDQDDVEYERFLSSPVVGISSGYIFTPYLTRIYGDCGVVALTTEGDVAWDNLLDTSLCENDFGSQLVVSVGNGCVFIPCMYGLCCFDERDGSFQWQKFPIYSDATWAQAVLVSEEMVYMGANALYAFDANNHYNKVWSNTDIGLVIGSPSMGADGALLVITKNSQGDYVLNSLDGSDSVCPMGTTFYNDTCRDCQPGYYSSIGAYCLPCESGTFSDDLAQEICSFCSEGKYTSQVASTACSDCQEIKKYRNIFPTLRVLRWSKNASKKFCFCLSSSPVANIAYSALPMTAMISHLLFFLTATFANRSTAFACLVFLFINCGIYALIGLFMSSFYAIKLLKHFPYWNSFVVSHLFCPFQWFLTQLEEEWSGLFSFLYVFIKIIIMLFWNLFVCLAHLILMGWFLIPIVCIFVVIMASLGAIAGAVGFELKVLGLVRYEKENHSESTKSANIRRVIQHAQTIFACLLGSFPQLMIVIANTSLLGNWTSYSIFSTIMSLLFIIDTIWKFIYIWKRKDARYYEVPTLSDTYITWSNDEDNFPSFIKTNRDKFIEKPESLTSKLVSPEEDPYLLT